MNKVINYSYNYYKILLSKLILKTNKVNLPIYGHYSSQNKIKLWVSVGEQSMGRFVTSLKPVWDLGGISSSVLSVFFTDNCYKLLKSLHLIGWVQICQWKTLTKRLMKCPPDHNPNNYVYEALARAYNLKWLFKKWCTVHLILLSTEIVTKGARIDWQHTKRRSVGCAAPDPSCEPSLINCFRKNNICST